MADRAREDASEDRVARFHREQRAAASLADSYFDQALRALRDAASADALWSREIPPHYGVDSLILGPAQQGLSAINERLMSLRTSVLFSALAIEATANEFLAIVLSPAVVETIDRRPMLEKLIVGPGLAGLDTPFDRGREPTQTLKLLSRARNALVHPRPGQAATLAHVVITEDDLRTYGPEAAVAYIKAAAHAGVLLRELLHRKAFFGATAWNIWTWRSVLDEHLLLFPEDIRDLPEPDQPSVRDLLTEMEARAVAGSTRDRRETTP